MRAKRKIVLRNKQMIQL